MSNAPERRGSSKNTLVTIAGDPARKDLLKDGIDITWSGLPGGARIGHRFCIPAHPENEAVLLLEAAAPPAAREG
jgi:hypothetical protein